MANHPGRFRYPSRAPALALASALAAASCGPGWDGMPVTLRVPALPACWSGASGWEVSWAGLERGGGPVLAEPGRALVLSLPRTSPAAVLCRPVFGTRRGLPYGAMWPVDALPDGSLAPDAAGGYAAALAEALYRGGMEAGGFDLRRFAREAAARMADPWDRDPASFADGVARGNFRADRLDQPARFMARLEGLTGMLAPDSPFRAPLAPGPGGIAELELAQGTRRWLDGERCLTVSMDAEGRYYWTLSASD